MPDKRVHGDNQIGGRNPRGQLLDGSAPFLFIIEH